MEHEEEELLPPPAQPTFGLLSALVERQREFQGLVNVPVGTLVEDERNRIAETMAVKAVAEVFELIRLFPSGLNPWAKSQPSEVHRGKLMFELADVLLYLVNFMLVWRIGLVNVFGAMVQKQRVNFRKVKEKKMALLNEEQLRVPGPMTGVGQGNLFPRFVFIGQNPGQAIPRQGYPFFSEPKGGAGVLLPILEELGIHHECYFTNLVKSVTPGNRPPDAQLIEFWKEFLVRELDIVAAGCDEPPVLIPMGRVTRDALGLPGIVHPATVLRGTYSANAYRQFIQQFIHDEEQRREKLRRIGQAYGAGEHALRRVISEQSRGAAAKTKE